ARARQYSLASERTLGRSRRSRRLRRVYILAVAMRLAKYRRYSHGLPSPPIVSPRRDEPREGVLEMVKKDGSPSPSAPPERSAGDDTVPPALLRSARPGMTPWVLSRHLVSPP